MTFRIRILILAMILSAVVSSVGAASYYSATPNSNPAPSPAVGSASSGVYFDHLVVIMLENEGIGDICGGNPPPCNGSNTPYLSSLANSYGISQQYLALISTSWPNYYGMIGASIFSCPSNCYPAPGSVSATNLVDRFEAAGVTWKGYFENQPLSAGCATSDSEPYTSIHNGFVLFQDITSNPARCNNLVRADPSGCSVTDCALINDLNSGSAPNFMWLSPSHCNDMQGSSSCSNGCTSDGSTTCLQDGDNYLKSLVPNILSSTTFQTGRSALFLTFDEGIGYCPLNSSSENCVYAVWAGPVAKTSYFSPVKYNHYSLTKTIEANWNLASLTSNDAGATAMSEFFGSPSPGFSMAANPSTSTIVAGGSDNTTVSLTSLGGFVGSVNLTATVSPSGPSISLNPSRVTLSSGGSASSIISISTTTNTPEGSYNVTATGTSGGITRKATWTVTVVSAAQYSLVISNDGRVFKYLQSGTMTQIGQPVTSPLRQVAWKPDASYALIVGDQSVLLKYDGATLTRITTNIGGNPAFFSVAWGADGAYAPIVGQAGTGLK